MDYFLEGIEHKTFGGPWTLIKLDILENYLKAYTTALKNRPFKLVYIDAFAGSGFSQTTAGVAVGSPLRALNCPFCNYYFFEKSEQACQKLNEEINNYINDPLFKEKCSGHPDKKIKIANADCNKLLETISDINWEKNKVRGVIFLDPFAMSLKWESLKHIAETKVFDVWYLFPYMGFNRNVPNNFDKADFYTKKIVDTLGDINWKDRMYKTSIQPRLFELDPEIEKVDRNEAITYINDRLKTIFPAVAPKPRILKNTTNSIIFTLHFAASTESARGQEIALRIAKHLIDK